MQPPETLLLSLVLLLTLAKIFEAPLRKLHLHPIPAHVLAGIILGPYVLGYVFPSSQLEGVAYLGLLLLLFYTGLNTDFRELKRHGKAILAMGGLGVIVTFTLIYYSMMFLGQDMIASLFIAAALSNTATETVAAIVAKKGDSTTRSLLIGASFSDDILAVFIIGVLSGLTHGGIDFISLTWISAKTGVFLASVFLVGELLVNKYKGVYRSMSEDYFWFASISVVLALVLSLTSYLAGLSELIGAYLAGILISRGREFHDPFLTTRIAITEFISDFSIVLDVLFVPLFFTYIGVAYKPGAINIPLYFILLTLAMIGKLAGTSPVAYYETRDSMKSISVGLAMGGRGSLETALLKLGLDTGIISETLFTTALTVAVTTTILAPLLYVVFYRSS